MAQLHVLCAPPPSVAATRPTTLSQRLWDLDWSKILPWELDDEVTIEHATFEDASPFIRAHYGEIFGSADGRFVAEPMTPAKRRFCSEMDFFVFRSKLRQREEAEDGIIGVFSAHPTDWSTYYLRSAAYLRDYRGRHYNTTITERICEVLRDRGVGRVEVETSPTNAPSVRILVNLGFVVTSTSTSERFGSLVRFTKFLQDDLGAAFARQFCAVAVTGPKKTAT
jgi:RimJ/RimL family protein N-acetyltransferase